MPKEVIKKAIEKNFDYHESVDSEVWDTIQGGQQPKITLITCSDSRVSGHIFGKDMINHVFHIRNIGNQIENNFGSVDYGINHLHTPILLILGHTDCGAVKASQSDFSGESDEIKKELYPLYFNLRLVSKNTDMGSHADVTKLVQENVDLQVKDAIKRYTTEGQYVVGAIFDIHSQLGDKPGRVIITNINGETDIEELKEHPLLSDLESSMKSVVVNRV
ncbi:carbonic anhydrase [archaeon]|jgi:carbonic anhydrase|nr:carbonic anhydrase [archaeon]MBT4351600.1 carbonic anhydrase [archaeon]MBT4648357.1 carbonic anhydrase [archaeon]MBT6822346.1 carbonic anhydrase [archaeon]MBT7391594.1 carbonic anhydrase [archaeon]